MTKEEKSALILKELKLYNAQKLEVKPLAQSMKEISLWLKSKEK